VSVSEAEDSENSAGARVGAGFQWGGPSLALWAWMNSAMCGMEGSGLVEEC
jgi:hypothetical protein